VLLFGIPATKDAMGSSGWDPAGPVPTAARAIRDAVGDELVVWADVCQCEYTDHGHCGPLTTHGLVDNDAAVEGYVRDALAYADAGVDLVAPSGMMDGQVAAIRRGLDAAGPRARRHRRLRRQVRLGVLRPVPRGRRVRHGRGRPRVAPDGSGQPPRGGRELAWTSAEGADVLMVKPALPYLDVLADARRNLDVPLAAYQVSGEYAMVKPPPSGAGSTATRPCARPSCRSTGPAPTSC
jgi:porphobilinogen synthase